MFVFPWGGSNGFYAHVFRHVSGRVDAQKEVVKERVGEDRCNI